MEGPPILVIDGANVVGSRPDGWWRDRAGAAARLHDAIASALTDGTIDHDVILVLEGDARGGVVAGQRESDHPGASVEVVHAQRDGDDAIVEVVRSLHARGERTMSVVVATADRELIRRVEELGATTVGPRSLLDRLDH